MRQELHVDAERVGGESVDIQAILVLRCDTVQQLEYVHLVFPLINAHQHVALAREAVEPVAAQGADDLQRGAG
eukprot:4730603-Prymnesium_polylepis.1